jgi:hypothetical protein
MEEWRCSSTILDLDTRWKQYVSFMFRPRYPGEKFLGTHWVGGWVGPRVGLDSVKERREKFIGSVGNQTPAAQLVARHYTD